MKNNNLKLMVLLAYTVILLCVYVHGAKKSDVAAADPVEEEKLVEEEPEQVVELTPSLAAPEAIAVSDSKTLRIISTGSSKPIVLEKVSDNPVYYRELTCLLLEECEFYEGVEGASNILIIPAIEDQKIVSGADIEKIIEVLSQDEEGSVSENSVSANSVSENAVSDNNVVKKKDATQASNTTPVGSDMYTGVPVAWDGGVLTKNKGVNQGPSGKETYYNLPMDGIVNMMRSMGNTDEHWIREDGVHMLGDYVMVAANLNLRPRGSYVQTSLGMGCVVDTGGFAYMNPTQIDIATTW